MTHVIFRTMTGNPLFQGIVGQKAKVKVMTEVDGAKYASQFKAKFTTLVNSAPKSEASSKNKLPSYAIEHCQVKFLNSEDRDNFV